MFKILFAFFALFANVAFADINVNKFDLVEIKPWKSGEDKGEPRKGSGKKYGLVMSSSSYNSSSKTVLIAAAVVKTKDYKGKYTIEITSNGVTYLVFVDKVRTIQKTQVEKTLFNLNILDAKKASDKWNDFTKNA